MFSRNNKRSSKNEIVGVFRNLFRGSSRKEIINMPDSKKTSLRNRIRARFSFKRSNSNVNNDFVWTTSTPYDSNDRRTKPSAVISPLMEHTDNSLNVSSILKQPNSIRLTNKKRLRFDDDNTRDAVFNDNKSGPCHEQTDETTVLHSMESDERYYKMMKEEILERSKESSIKNSRSKISKPQRKNKSKCEDVVNISTLQLLYGDKLETDSFPVSEDFVKFFKDSEFEGGIQSSSFVQKIGSIKKNKDHRFNPMAKEQSCGVAILSAAKKDQQSDGENMSWCTA